MRVDFWPSINNEKPEAYFSLDLSEKAIDYLLDSTFKLVAQFDGASEVRENIQKFRVQSPAMLLTCCQSKSRQPGLEDLNKIAELLKSDLDGARWEIRIPTDRWSIDEDDSTPFDLSGLLQPVAAEVSA